MKQCKLPPNIVKHKNFVSKHEKKIITQQISKETRINKLEEDSNGLQLLWFFSFLKNCEPNSFQSHFRCL